MIGIEPDRMIPDNDIRKQRATHVSDIYEQVD